MHKIYLSTMVAKEAPPLRSLIHVLTDDEIFE